MASKRLQTTLRRLSSLLNLKSRFLSPPQPPSHLRLFLPRILEASRRFNLRSTVPPLRTFSSLHSDGPTAIDYRSTLQEDEFHSLANSTIHKLQERFEEYGDIVQIDGFDIDYGNEVLTLKLGDLGTYVLNKQTPNRQLWLSSPVSGPSRFDWDQSAQTWVYRRTKANLLKILESELEQLCGEPIKLA